MRHSNGKIFSLVSRLLTRLLPCVLICVFLLPMVASATPRPLDAGTVHVKVMKRGIGRWIGIEEQNGVQIFGRIIAIGDHSLILQLHNDPQTTEIYYSDVADLRTGFTTGQKVLMVAGFAAVGGLATYGFVHIHDLNNKPLAPPATPLLTR